LTLVGLYKSYHLELQYLKFLGSHVLMAFLLTQSTLCHLRPRRDILCVLKASVLRCSWDSTLSLLWRLQNNGALHARGVLASRIFPLVLDEVLQST
jgi:hypothetical protein